MKRGQPERAGDIPQKKRIAAPSAQNVDKWSIMRSLTNGHRPKTAILYNDAPLGAPE